MSISQIIDGPLWYLALAVFLIGAAWRLLAILFMGLRRDYSEARRSGSVGAIRAIFSRFVPERAMWSGVRMHVLAGYLFHLGLFALLLFAVPHVEFYRDKLFGTGWTAMPHWAFVLASEAAFLGLLILWLNRVLNPVTRMISSTGDHLASILTFLVMLSGCLALGRAHESLRLVHFFLVEMLMIYFPFSSLMHAFTFVISRGALGAHYGRRGVSV
jgi:nitrate reductase gamma subunit